MQQGGEAKQADNSHLDDQYRRLFQGKAEHHEV
jgi:hypothetical protein